MADQSLAQDSTLKTSVVRNPHATKLIRKMKQAWIFGSSWARYAMAGPHPNASELVDFVLAKHFFPANQIASELTALGEILAALRPERALEIGTANGGTLLFLARLASSRARIVSVDLPEDKSGRGYKPWRRWAYQKFARRGQRLHLLQGDSHSSDMLARVKAALGDQTLDYLFIDGDHTYEGVKCDFEMYAPLVHQGGIIALHDIAEHPAAVGCEVSRFWNEIKCRFRHNEIVESRQQGWAGIGVLYVE
jgi:predicted O-methyltransferase YrrM